MRPMHGAKPIDMAAVREAVRDKRIYLALGLVVQRDGDNSHFQILNEDGEHDVLVEVDLQPNGENMTCRLGSFGGGQTGVWRIPPAGTEVMVAIPDGELDGVDSWIFGTLSSGAVPDPVDADTLVIINAKNVHIESTDGDITVDAGNGKVKVQGGGKGAAREDDTTDNGTVVFVPGTSGATFSFIPPGGITPPAGPTVFPLSGKINSSSSKTEIG